MNSRYVGMHSILRKHSSLSRYSAGCLLVISDIITFSNKVTKNHGNLAACYIDKPTSCMLQIINNEK